jgi:hypothetical protein
MTRFAEGGTMPARPAGDDEVPAVLSPGRVILIGKPNLFATTPEGAALLARLNGPTPAGDDAEAWVCGRCERGQCGRCSDPDCTCCNGNPEDQPWR